MISQNSPQVQTAAKLVGTQASACPQTDVQPTVSSQARVQLSLKLPAEVHPSPDAIAMRRQQPVRYAVGFILPSQNCKALTALSQKQEVRGQLRESQQVELLPAEANETKEQTHCIRPPSSTLAGCAVTETFSAARRSLLSHRRDVELEEPPENCLRARHASS